MIKRHLNMKEQKLRMAEILGLHLVLERGRWDEKLSSSLSSEHFHSAF